MAFLAYDPATHNLNSLVSAIFAGAGGVSLVPGSVAVRYGTIEGQASLSFYDGSLTALNIGAGLLLTSGDSTPPLANNETAYGEALDGDTPGEPDLQATVQAAFPGAGELEDITSLQFSIQVSDPAATGLRFDVVFGSDEFPEFSNTSFVDVAGVYVNGVNYALFNRNASQPLSIIDANLTAGNFRDNQGGSLPLEYDGISNRLQITAPLVQGTNTIKIAIADTGDAIYDSGIFVSGLQAVNYAGYGLAQQVAVTGSAQLTDSAENQVYQCDNLGNVVLLVSGQDVVDGGGGVDKVKYTFTISGISGYHWDGQVLSVQNGANASTLVNVERVQLGDGSLYALDTGIGGNTFDVYAMLYAAFGQAPSTGLLSDWVADADALLQTPGRDLGDLGQALIDRYAPGVSNQAFVSYLFQALVGRAATAPEVQSYTDMIGPGRQFETAGDLYAYAALLGLNTNKIAGIVGSIQPLEASYFA